ncbi:CsbD family protein [Amycolatopsis sp. AA4]|uniref:CsbD family protein n=1 Tax=Actinomycetes TaxID=1760 RepID=UPI0001B58B1A|nr:MULTISPECIES: CsbD family protein [Actinomycetes]ATY11928.1 CsbD family protein [Amycolatopsis sp. AA4]
MSTGDKIGAKADDFGGKAKEAAGSLTGDEKLKQEGKADQAKAGIKEAAENVKDALGGAADKVKNALKKD